LLILTMQFGWTLGYSRGNRFHHVHNYKEQKLKDGKSLSPMSAKYLAEIAWFRSLSPSQSHPSAVQWPSHVDVIVD
jgi:hypothetical protein